MNQPNSLATATKRTAWNGTLSTWLALVIAWAASKLGVDVDLTHPAVVAVIGVGAPFFIRVAYRASREAANRWPALGRILFGDPTDPTYR